MEKKVRMLSAMKWLGFPLGFIMYFGTVDAFGDVISSLLCGIATLSFWFLVRRECNRVIGQSIADEIRDAIKGAGAFESIIEIKRASGGIIARVYLIGAREKVNLIRSSISNKFEHSSLRKYLWIMQLTDMPSKDYLKATQKKLNDQLMEELMEIQRNTREARRNNRKK